MLDTMALDRWLSPSEAARELGVTAGRVRQMVEEGKIPAIRTALGRLVDGDAVTSLARERKRPHRYPSGTGGDAGGTDHHPTRPDAGRPTSTPAVVAAGD